MDGTQVDLKIGGLTISIRGKAESWDSEGLDVAATFISEYSQVYMNGIWIFGNYDLNRFLAQLQEVYELKSSSARLVGLEENLVIEISRQGSLGALSVRALFVFHSEDERHEYNFPSDLSYLDALMRSCKKAIALFGSKVGDYS